MGFKGSKVQILSSRPENRNPKGSTGTWVPFLFLAPEEPGLGAGPFPSFRCSCLPAMSRSRIIRDQTSRWSLDYGKSIGLLPAGQTGPRSQSEPPAKRVVCSGPIRAYYRLRLKTLAFTLFKPSALAALTTP